MNAPSALIARDLRLSLTRGSDGLAALFFFAVVASLFPFALGPDAALLQKCTPGIVWVCALLASLLSLETIWHRDFEDGTFDLLLLSPIRPAQIILAKMTAHWAISGLLLLPAAALAALMLATPAAALCAIIPSLMLGTLYMSLLGALGAVLTFGARRPGILLVLLILPLFIPMLILGVMTGEAALNNAPVAPYMLLQLSLVIAALALTPAGAAKFLDMQVRS